MLVALSLLLSSPASAQHLHDAAPEGPPGFVVTVEPGADAARVARDHGVKPEFVYRHAITGFAGTVPESARQGLFRDPRVVRIERDGVVRADEIALSWGLDRVDQRASPLDGVYGTTATGAGVTAYVVDSGLRTQHSELAGRARVGVDVLGDAGIDCNGHGTHVAATLGGRTYGVADGVDLVGVRALDCAGLGTTSGVIAALDWIAAEASGPSVVSLSLSGPANTAMNEAVQRLFDQGLVVVAAAGNSDKDACGYSPAAAPAAITVGATDREDARAAYSNHGACLDLFAPGSGIVSAWATSDEATASMSGTSMAAAHVAGVAALVLSDDPHASPADVTAAILGGATPGVVQDSLSARPDLLFVSVGTGSSTPPPPPLNVAPTAGFSVACEGLVCTFTDTSADTDGEIVGWSWGFGDGAGSASPSPSHTFAGAGAWTVSLAVTDDGAATGGTSASVAVAEPGAPLELSAVARKVKGKHATALTWTGARAASVDIWRDGSLILTTTNDGEHVDATATRGAATYRYQVCEAGTAWMCTPERTITY